MQKIWIKEDQSLMDKIKEDIIQGNDLSITDQPKMRV